MCGSRIFHTSMKASASALAGATPFFRPCK